MDKSASFYWQCKQIKPGEVTGGDVGQAGIGQASPLMPKTASVPSPKGERGKRGKGERKQTTTFQFVQLIGKQLDSTQHNCLTNRTNTVEVICSHATLWNAANATTNKGLQVQIRGAYNPVNEKGANVWVH